MEINASAIHCSDLLKRGDTPAVRGENAGGKAEWFVRCSDGGIKILSGDAVYRVFLIDSKVNYCKVSDSLIRFS